MNGEKSKIGHPFSKEDSVNPYDSYSISKFEAEQGLMKLAEETGLEVVIIRPPLVYGNGAKGNFKALHKLLTIGCPLPLASIKDNKRSLVGIDNLVSLIEVCVEHPNATNQVLLVSDNDDLSTRELVKLFGASIDRSPILIPCPAIILKLFGKCFGVAEKIERLLGTLQIDIRYTSQLLGWKPPYSVRHGFRKIKKSKI